MQSLGKFNWVKVWYGGEGETFRAKVIGGWLVMHTMRALQSSRMIFIADPDHTWELNDGEA